MSFRDDDDAQRCLHDDLARELTRLETRLGELHHLAAERERIAAQLAAVRRDVEAREARKGPVRLTNLRVASPCKESWDNMVGDERVRVCNRCEKPVFNLSSMTQEEAETILASKGFTPCVRFFRRADGTIKTADCPSTKRKVAVGVAAAALAAAGFAGVSMSRGGGAHVADVQVQPPPIEHYEEIAGGMEAPPYVSDVGPNERAVPHMGQAPRVETTEFKGKVSPR